MYLSQEIEANKQDVPCKKSNLSLCSKAKRWRRDKKYKNKDRVVKMAWKNWCCKLVEYLIRTCDNKFFKG